MVPRRAVVLAAGRGTRLGELTAATPKPLLQIGGRAAIDRIIDSLADGGLEEIAVVTGHLAEQLERHVASTSQLPVTFVRQLQQNGTGGALLAARDFVGDQPFVLCWGDIAADPSIYTRVIETWGTDVAAVVAVNRLADVSQGSAVVFDEQHRITAIVEKPASPPPSNWNSAGVMLLGPKIWPHLARLQPSPRGELELTDALAALIRTNAAVLAAPFEERWFDIGTAASLRAADAAFS